MGVESPDSRDITPYNVFPWSSVPSFRLVLNSCPKSVRGGRLSWVVVSGETVLKEDLLCCSFVVGSLTESVLERVKKIDRKLDELRTFLEDVFLTPEESVLLKDADRLVKGKKFEELTSLDDV